MTNIISKKDLVGYQTTEQINKHNSKCDLLIKAQKDSQTKTKSQIWQLKEKIAMLENKQYEIDKKLEAQINRNWKIKISAKEASEQGLFDDVIATAEAVDLENCTSKRIYEKSNGSWVEINTFWKAIGDHGMEENSTTEVIEYLVTNFTTKKIQY